MAKEQKKEEGMMSPYRALDLTDEKGFLCGKVLGDMGADVIKIERPGGDPARNIGPFYHDEPHPEKSLFWFAFNTSKRGITLNLETADGQEIFKKLLKTTDFVIESFSPGYLDKIGLGYSALAEINPRVIMVSITPFGQTGPYKDYKAPNLVAWAMGTHLYIWGDKDRPPIGIDYHSQPDLLGSVDAVVGALLALRYREMTGEGQHVDESIHEAVIRCPFLVVPTWSMVKRNVIRGDMSNPNLNIPRVWECKDGEVVWSYRGGDRASDLNGPLVKWMEREGMATEYLVNFDWDRFNLRTTTQDVIDRISEPTAKFFEKYTKAEIMEGALGGRVDVYPVSTTKDLLENPQFKARNFWTELEHSELGSTLPYPGGHATTTEASPKPSRRAPLIGEHNLEIYEKELGLSREELIILKQANVI